MGVFWRQICPIFSLCARPTRFRHQNPPHHQNPARNATQAPKHRHCTGHAATITPPPPGPDPPPLTAPPAGGRAFGPGGGPPPPPRHLSPAARALRRRRSLVAAPPRAPPPPNCDCAGGGGAAPVARSAPLRALGPPWPPSRRHAAAASWLSPCPCDPLSAPPPLASTSPPPALFAYFEDEGGAAPGLPAKVRAAAAKWRRLRASRLRRVRAGGSGPARPLGRGVSPRRPP